MTEENKELAVDENGFTEEMTALDSRQGDIKELDLESGEVTTADPDNENKPDEGAEYWKNKYNRAAADHNDLAQYEALIDELKSRPDVVKVLEEKLSREVAGVEDTDYSSPDYPWGAPDEGDAPKKQAPSPDDLRTQVANERAIQKAQEDVQAFVGTLGDIGVPDHTVDEFLEFLKNPSGTTVQDLWAAYESQSKRVKGENDLPENGRKKKGAKGSPSITDMGGTTDRPNANQYTSHEGGHNYVPDANDL